MNDLNWPNIHPTIGELHFPLSKHRLRNWSLSNYYLPKGRNHSRFERRSENQPRSHGVEREHAYRNSFNREESRVVGVIIILISFHIRIPKIFAKLKLLKTFNSKQ